MDRTRAEMGALSHHFWSANQPRRYDAEGMLNGEFVGLSQQTTFRPGDTSHKFLHATRDDIRFLFTVENGRATKATMHQGAREISGPRTQ